MWFYPAEENKKLTERISLLQEEVNKRAKKEEEEELNKDLYIENAISELIIEVIDCFGFEFGVGFQMV